MTVSLGRFGLLLLPGIVMVAGGALLLLLRGLARDVVVLAVPVAVLALIWTLPEGAAPSLRWLGYDLVPFHSDPLSRLFGSAFAIAALAAGLFGMRQEKPRETPIGYLYAGGAIGVAFAGDFLTLFAFWELMAVCATLVVWQGGARAHGAGQRYIVIHVLSGILMLIGIAGQVAATGSIAVGPVALDSAGTWFLLVGVVINVAAWPMSAWVPDAYPSANWSGMAFLSAFTTKASVLVLIQSFAGTEMLVPLGLATIVYGTIYAARESDIRRLVAYSLVVQLGFMVTASGVGSDLAVNGATAHAVAGIFYQALLFMVAGSVVLATGRSDCGDLGGLWRAMPVAAVGAIVGAAAIAAFPLTSGYVAKGMISDAVGAAGSPVAWFVVTAGAAAVVLHAGLRLPWTVFFAARRDAPAASGTPLTMQLAMGLLAAVTVALGVFPSVFLDLLPRSASAEPYSASHIVGQVQLLAFAGLGLVLVWRWVAAPRALTLDVDWLWRRLGPRIVDALDDGAGHIRPAFMDRAWRGMDRFVRTVYRHHGPQGVLARTWPTGSMALSAVLLLAAYLAFYYL